MSKYETHNDPYTYKDKPDVLINKFNIKNKEELDDLEQALVSTRMSDIDKYPKGNYDFKHYRKIHKHLFEELYDWAGEVRQVTTQKGTTIFAHPRFIEPAYNDLYKQMKKDNFLKNIKKEDLHKPLAFYHGEINIIHLFREGNGRTTRAFLSLMAKESHNIELDYLKIKKEHLIIGSINSSGGDYDLMEKLYKHILPKNIEKKIEKDVGFDR
ncbi:MAG: Fic family protein [Alphaproteobacteria bacterium]|jgi:cell filamentation protein|nr:Fic family protein [Alphaproteobacteria bacterium]